MNLSMVKLNDPMCINREYSVALVEINVNSRFVVITECCALLLSTEYALGRCLSSKEEEMYAS